MFKKNILIALGLFFHSVIFGKLVILARAGGWGPGRSSPTPPSGSLLCTPSPSNGASLLTRLLRKCWSKPLTCLDTYTCLIKGFVLRPELGTLIIQLTYRQETDTVRGSSWSFFIWSHSFIFPCVVLTWRDWSKTTVWNNVKELTAYVFLQEFHGLRASGI